MELTEEQAGLIRSLLRQEVRRIDRRAASSRRKWGEDYDPRHDERRRRFVTETLEALR